MGDVIGPPNLPAQVSEALASLPKAMVPSVAKALDRLLGAAVDLPTAWLAQKKAKIDAQTESYKLVEATIAQAAAAGVQTDPEIAQRAINVLARSEYRKQVNREAVAKAMVEDMRTHASTPQAEEGTSAANPLEEDWLNVFERYAEDASSERIQGLLTCHGIFPPSAIRVRPKEGTDNEANNSNRRADHRDLAGA